MSSPHKRDVGSNPIPESSSWVYLDNSQLWRATQGRTNHTLLGGSNPGQLSSAGEAVSPTIPSVFLWKHQLPNSNYTYTQGQEHSVPQSGRYKCNRIWMSKMKILNRDLYRQNLHLSSPQTLSQYLEGKLKSDLVLQHLSFASGSKEVSYVKVACKEHSSTMQSKASFILKLNFSIKIYEVYWHRSVYSFIKLWLMPVTKILSRKINVSGYYLSPFVIYKDYTFPKNCLFKHKFQCCMYKFISSILMMLKKNRSKDKDWNKIKISVFQFQKYLGTL